jgi:hypothetical protein
VQRHAQFEGADDELACERKDVMIRWLVEIYKDAMRYRWVSQHLVDWYPNKLKLCVTMENTHGNSEVTEANLRRFNQLVDNARSVQPVVFARRTMPAPMAMVKSPTCLLAPCPMELSHHTNEHIVYRCTRQGCKKTVEYPNVD